MMTMSSNPTDQTEIDAHATENINSLRDPEPGFPKSASKQYMINLRDVRFYEPDNTMLKSEVSKQSFCQQLALILQARHLGLSLAQLNAVLNLPANGATVAKFKELISSKDISSKIDTLERWRKDLDREINELIARQTSASQNL
jgi:DNA-binding transcriptional MerR regulator